MYLQKAIKVIFPRDFARSLSSLIAAISFSKQELSSGKRFNFDNVFFDLWKMEK